MNKVFHLLYRLLPILVIFTSCATISAPGGGPKDEKVPVLVESSIPEYATNFQDNNIILTFDEYIRLDNPSKNIFTSPPLGNKVNYVVKKNKLFIIFKEPLEEDITYHLNFSNSIRDVNESNILSNFQLVFSTGPVLDSLTVSGSLQPINDIKMGENTIVGLYRDLSDTAFSTKAPFYFTYADKTGHFSFENIKNGTYKMVALTDANNNFYYDLPNENIGFLQQTVNLQQIDNVYEIPLFLPEEATFRVTSFSAKVETQKLTFSLSRPISPFDTYDIVIKGDSITIPYVPQISDDRKTITAWLKIPEDFTGNKLSSLILVNSDTLNSYDHIYADKKLPPFKLNLKTPNLTVGDSLIVYSSNPVASHADKWLLKDTLKQDTLQLFVTQISDYQLLTILSPEIKQDVVYTLLILNNELSDIYDQKNEAFTKSINISSPEERGTLLLKFEAVDTSIQYLVTLLDQKKQTVQTKNISKDKNTWLIKNLIPGNYSVKIVEDQNKNSVWNSGSYRTNKYPEPIYTYDKEFIIRPNWDLEESVNLKR